MTDLPDLQNREDSRGKFIQKVGISNFRAPIKVRLKDGSTQSTVARISLYGSLNEQLKGMNLSRLSQTIMKAIDKDFTVDFLIEIVGILKEKLESGDSYAKLVFPLFLKREAPITENQAYSEYIVTMEARLHSTVQPVCPGDIEELDLYVTVAVPYMSVCPCSKEMSLVENVGLRDVFIHSTIYGKVGMGAHMQRSLGTLKIHYIDPKCTVALEDLIEIVELSGSAPIYNTLKRPDEKYVTEQGYNNPKFCEDVARDVALKVEDRLMRHKYPSETRDGSHIFPFVDGFSFVAKHEESIHQYDAIAVIRGGTHFVE